jgi:hypothetical protein
MVISERADPYGFQGSVIQCPSVSRHGGTGDGTISMYCLTY